MNLPARIACIGVALLLSVFFPASSGLWCQSFNPLAKYGISVTASENFKYWWNDAAVVGLEHNYQNLLDLVFVKKDLTFGVQLNHANFFPANPEVPTEKINGIRKLYLEYRHSKVNLTLGDFYASLGSGLVLAVTKDEALLQDRTIFGGMAAFGAKGFKWKVLAGVADQELTGEKDSIYAAEMIFPKIKKTELAARISHACDYNSVIIDGNRTTGTLGLTRSFWGFLDFNGEIGYMWHEGSSRNGHAAYAGTNIYKGPWSMLVEYKDYFRFDNGFNNPPLVDLEDEEALLGDIYGLYIKNNYSWVKKNIDFYGSYGFYTFWNAPKDTHQYYGGFIKPDLFGRLYLQAEYGLRTELQNKHRALINADFSLTDNYSIQYMLSGNTKISDLGDLSEWHMVAGFSRASLFSVSYVYEFGSRSAIGKTEFSSLKVDWDVTDAFRASVFYGSSRGGLICSGGICRFEPPFDGLKFSAEYRF